MTCRIAAVLVVCTTILGTLAACGGASMDVTIESPGGWKWPPPGPIDVFATIEQSGAVQLMGVRFDAGTADVVLDGWPAPVADLGVGQVVHVVGQVHDDRVTGRADLVESEAAVLGPVESVDRLEASFVVLGQKVRTHATGTWFAAPLAPSFASGIDVGTWVRVHGWRNEAAEILATRVSSCPAGDRVQVVGHVSAHDVWGTLFEVAGLPVQYGAAERVDVPGGALDEGQTVVVRGRWNGDTLEASEIRAVPWQMVRVFSDPW